MPEDLETPDQSTIEVGEQTRENNPQTPEEKQELVTKAIDIFDEMATHTKRNKFAEMAGLTEIKTATDGVTFTAQNAPYSEPGAREMQRQTEGIVQEMRRTIRELADNNGQLGFSHSADSEFMKDLLERAAQEKDPEKALQLANGAVAKFKALTTETSESKYSSENKRRALSLAAHENSGDAQRLAARIEDELRKDIGDLHVSQFARESKRLDTLIDGAVSTFMRSDRDLIGDNSRREREFEQTVREIIKEHLPIPVPKSQEGENPTDSNSQKPIEDVQRV